MKPFVRLTWGNGAVAAAAAATGLVLAGCGEPMELDPSIEAEQGAIVGGTTVVPHELPYMGFFGCGATLLNPSWLITAAHCTLDVPLANLRFIMGDHDILVAEGPEQTRTAVRKYDHLWDLGKFNNDISLVKVSPPFTLNANVATLPFATTPPAVGTSALVSGWGNSAWQTPGPTKLQKATVPIRHTDLCGTTGDSLLCAGSSTGSPGACNGDSGGPLTFVRNGKRYLTGIVSSTAGCQSYNGYTSVSQFTSWIRNTIWQPPTVIAMATDGRLQKRTLNEDTGVWTPFTALPGVIKGSPALAADNDGRLWAFACGTANDLLVRTTTDAAGLATWSPWTSLGGSCLIASPAVAMSRDTIPKLTVFTTDVASNPAFRTWDSSTGVWSGWSTLAGGPMVSMTATTTRFGRLMLFGRGQDNVVYTRFREADSAVWTAWTPLAGNATAAPASIETPEGRIHVFANGAGTIRERIWDPLTNAWSGWLDRGAGFNSSFAPSVTELDGGTKLAVFARTTANTIAYRTNDITTNAWTAWLPLAGTVATGPAAN
jgi:trypsin